MLLTDKMRYWSMRILLALSLPLFLVSIACTSQTSNVMATAAPTRVEQVKSDTLLWLTDMKEALKVAEREDKDILAVFAGSDWCRPCKQFKMAVLDDAQFKQHQLDKLIVLYLDFPSKRRNALSADATKHNEYYAERYNPEGVFPRIILLDSKEKNLGELKYMGEDAPSFEQALTSLRSSK